MPEAVKLARRAEMIAKEICQKGLKTVKRTGI